MVRKAVNRFREYVNRKADYWPASTAKADIRNNNNIRYSTSVPFLLTKLTHISSITGCVKFVKWNLAWMLLQYDMNGVPANPRVWVQQISRGSTSDAHSYVRRNYYLVNQKEILSNNFTLFFMYLNNLQTGTFRYKFLKVLLIPDVQIYGTVISGKRNKIIICIIVHHLSSLPCPY